MVACIFIETQKYLNRESNLIKPCKEKCDYFFFNNQTKPNIQSNGSDLFQNLLISCAEMNPFLRLHIVMFARCFSFFPHDLQGFCILAGSHKATIRHFVFDALTLGIMVNFAIQNESKKGSVLRFSQSTT